MFLSFLNRNSIVHHTVSACLGVMVMGSALRAAPSIFDDDYKPPASKPGKSSPAGKNTTQRPSGLPGTSTQGKPGQPTIPEPGGPLGANALGGTAPLPAGDAQSKAERKIAEAHRAEYVKATPSDRAALAAVLLNEASNYGVESAERYICLREARDLGAIGGAAQVSMDAIDLLAKTFAIDPIAMRADAFAKLARTATSPADRETLAKECLAAFDEAQNSGRYEQVGKLAGVTDLIAERMGPVPLASQLKRRGETARALKVEFDKAKAAAIRLKRNPRDIEAGVQAGMFLCLAHGDWDAGLPMLSVATDGRIKSVATAETKKPTAASGQVALADLWVEVAKFQTGYMKQASELRAASWYRQAIPLAPEPQKSELLKKLEALPGQVPYTKIAAAAKIKSIDRSKLAGGRIGNEFTDVHAAGGVVIGLSITVKGTEDAAYIAGVQPILDTPDGRQLGAPRGPAGNKPVVVEAREGYAVANILARGVDRVDGLKVTFMRIKGATLDSSDAYESEWVGGKGAGLDVLMGNPADAKLVVGITGTIDAQLISLGLVRLR